MSIETEYFHGLSTDDAKLERASLREKVLTWLGVLCLLILVALATDAAAMPIYEAAADGAKITLTDDNCKLKEVSNLPKRATWLEKGKLHEGCYGVNPDGGFVVAYFDDATVVVLPIHIFSAVRGA